MPDPMNTGYYAPANTGTVVLSSTYSGPVANLAPLSGGTLVINNNVSAGTLECRRQGPMLAPAIRSLGPVTLSSTAARLPAPRPSPARMPVADPLLWGTNNPTLNIGGAFEPAPEFVVSSDYQRHDVQHQ